MIKKENKDDSVDPGLEAFENDISFFDDGYDPDRHLANQATLNILKNIRPHSPPGFHVARAFSEQSNIFFVKQNVFPLRSFIKQRSDKDEYVKNLAGNSFMVYLGYMNDVRAVNSKARKAKQDKKLTTSAETDVNNIKPSAIPTIMAALDEEDEPTTRRKKDPVIKQLASRYPSYATDNEIKRGADPLDWAYLNEFFEQRVARDEIARKEHEKDLIRNVDNLSKELGLDDIDCAIFKYVIAYQRDKRFSKFLEKITENKATQMAIAARSLGVDKAEFGKRVGVNGDLNRKNLIKAKQEDEWPVLNEGVYTILKRSTGETSDYISKICGEVRPADLTKDDYPHLAVDTKKAEEILKDALATKKKGVNILIWGPVGTGKTELAAVLGNGVAKRFYRPGEKDDGKHEILTRKQRFEALSLAQAMLKGSDDVVIGLDEMEDFLQTSEEASPQGKAHFNRVLEDNPVPVIWTVNSVAKFDPAVLRRFSWSIYAPPPPAGVRAGMYKRIAGRMGREITEADATELGKKFSVPPALIQKAFDTDFALNKDAKVVKENLIASIENSSHLLHGTKGAFEQKIISAKSYDLSLANAKVANLPYSLEKVSMKLKGTKKPITLMLYGKPGTGKTAFGEYFSENVLDKEVLEKDYAEVSSKWVGESEKNIAAMFEEAYYEEKTLMLNEADSLLRDRALARANWEITQTNQVLTQMERTKVPVIMTTNLVKELDPATRRRFMLQIELNTLEPKQVEQCYQTFFQRELPKRNFISNIGLATGDFASVAALYDAFDKNMDDEELQSFLESKVKGRSDFISSVGFNTTRPG